MRMPPVLLLGRSPSAIVPQGVFGWIYVGRLVVLLVPPAPLVPAEAASLGCLVPRCLGPLKALAAPTPPDCLAPGPLGPWEALASPWWRVPRGRLLPRRQVSTRWPAPPGRLTPPLRLAESVLSVAALESPPVSPRAARRCLRHPASSSASFPCGGAWVWRPPPEELSLSPGAARLS